MVTRLRGPGLRRCSHYGYGDGKKIVAVHTYYLVNKGKWLPRGYRAPLHQSFLALAVLCRFSRSKNSPSETLIRCFAPALPTQEPRITVSIAFLVVAVGSAYVSRNNSLPSSSTSMLGCTSRARLLGEGRVSLMAEHGEDLPWLGTELLPTAFQSVKRYVHSGTYLCQT